MKKYFAILAVAGLVLTGCSAPNEATKQTVSPTNPLAGVTADGPPVTPTNVPPAVAETTPPPDEPSVAKVGATQWFTYSDGLKVQVTKVARTGKGVVVTITIRNGTKKTADLSLTTVHLAYGPNGNAAEAVYDMDFGMGFSGSVTPGKAKTARFGFTVPKNQTIDVEVEPGFLDYESCHFEGVVK